MLAIRGNYQAKILDINTLLSLLFTTKFSYWINFNFLRWNKWKPNVKFEKENTGFENVVSIFCIIPKKNLKKL